MNRLKFLIGAFFLASIIFFTVTVNAAELVILHTNDIHARVLNTDDYGKSMGFAEMVAGIKKLKSQNLDSLWLDAGDTLHGMPAINISNGSNMLNLLNIAGLNAMTLGNQEFNYGIDTLINLTKKAKFDVLASNLVYRSNDKLIFKPYKIYKMPDGLRVGVFGLTTPETQIIARPTLVRGINFLNPVEIAKDMVKEMRPKCDVLIALTHLGIDEHAAFTSIRLANEVDGIDLIVDGHSHTVLPSGLTINNTLIVQTGWHAYNLGKTTITLDGKKIINKKAELLDADAIKKIAPTPDKNVAAAITKMERENKKLLDQVIAQNDKTMSVDITTMRTQETEFGDLVTDAFRWKTGADCAVINGGGVREGLLEGNVTKGDVMKVFPFGNQLQRVEVQGSVIREMLEHSVSQYPDAFGAFLHVSGIKFTFSPENTVGSRVGDIYIGNEPLNENLIYTMATSDFLIEGGNGYDVLKKHHLVTGQFGTLEEILIEYLQESGMKKIDMGRIIVAK
ncbi:MAG: bifunctional metallophosphatase/5'-nucleotidase [Selenomonadaceae bacterium]|nr:bifunctional metallophosphatase/5'-nucleotidase [Selenomonadaceae bacterium]